MAIKKLLFFITFFIGELIMLVYFGPVVIKKYGEDFGVFILIGFVSIYGSMGSIIYMCTCPYEDKGRKY
jgi:hypothetical protein